jgi:MFS family permease
MGMFETTAAFGMIIGPSVGGVLAERLDPSYPYLLRAIASIACTFVVGVFLKRRKQE